MPDESKPQCASGPMFPKRQLLCAILFLLREIEVADLRLHPSSISFVGKTVLLHLPVSKMDPDGKGATRAHTCCCARHNDTSTIQPLNGGEGRVIQDNKAVCVYCALKQQVADISEFYGVNPRDDVAADLPLFPSKLGKVVSKASTVKSWQGMLTSVVGRSAAQKRRVRGHTGRRSGAKSLTRLGWRRDSVQFMGRWGGDTVDIYIGEVRGETALPLGQGVPEWAPAGAQPKPPL